MSESDFVIHAISDLHGHKPKLPGGDALIIAGDCTGVDTASQWRAFGRWLGKQAYAEIILVAGNHDGLLYENKDLALSFMPPNLTYLEDWQTWLANGISIYGTPWTPRFNDWYFMADRGDEMRKKLDSIPTGIDILVSHGPPYGILDQINKGTDEEPKMVSQGCRDLIVKINQIKPKINLFGHLHENGSKRIHVDGTDFYNVAYLDERYNPGRKVTRIEI
jgi:Icc-related predicted phosphoesterase